MRKNHLTLNIFILIVMTDVMESVAQLFLKKGLNAVGMASLGFANVVEFFVKSSSTPFIWLGLAVHAANFFLWITVLSRIDLSVAFPVGSTSYIFVPILAMLFLGETINPVRWLGIILIIAGIHFVSQSTKVKEFSQERE